MKCSKVAIDTAWNKVTKKYGGAGTTIDKNARKTSETP
jgi:hypothetical protein